MARSLHSVPTETPLEVAVRAVNAIKADLDTAIALVQAEAAREVERSEQRRQWERSQEGYVTAAQIAVHLQVSKAYVYQLLETGHLPSISLGVNRRVKRADLDAYIDSLRQQESA